MLTYIANTLEASQVLSVALVMFYYLINKVEPNLFTIILIMLGVPMLIVNIVITYYRVVLLFY